MIKPIKTKLFAPLSVAFLAVSLVLPYSVGIAQGAVNTTKTVYIDIEKNVLQESPLLEPVAVTLDDTSTVLDATKEAYGASNVDTHSPEPYPGLYDRYVEAFADTDTAFTYDYASAISTATNGVVYRTDLPHQPIVSDPNWLRETEYNGISGWMLTVNNAFYDGSYNYYSAITPLSSLPDGAVIRWEFSEAFGADLGMDNAYVPTQVTAAGFYNWSTCVPFAARFDRADKTTLISKMALNKTDPDYPDALDALKELTIDQSDVDDAAALLP